jgi:2-hydroxy-3-oxopropionate reductase
MTRIAFVGLGIMGLPMAANLAKAGNTVVGVVRPGRDHPRAEAQGLVVTDDLTSAVREADVIITMLPDTPDVRATVAAAAPHLRPGQCVIDMSTIDPSATRELREAILPPSVGMLDAPVSGGEAGAIEAALSIMVGGSKADFAAARPLLDAMGKKVVHVGPTGAGQVVKAANQLIVAGNIQMLAEAIVFLRAQGADLGSALDVIGGGLAGSTALARKREALLGHRFAPGFRIELHVKDMGIVETASESAGISLPLTAAVTQLLRALVDRGDGGLDHSALLKLAEELNAQNLATD